jgi:hypothetical protein
MSKVSETFFPVDRTVAKVNETSFLTIAEVYETLLAPPALLQRIMKPASLVPVLLQIYVKNRPSCLDIVQLKGQM